MLLACDQPAVDSGTIRRLTEAFRPPDATIVACAYAGVAGIPALFGWRHAAELLELRGDTGARAVLRRHPDRVRTVGCPEAETDVDAPEDLRALE